MVNLLRDFSAGIPLPFEEECVLFDLKIDLLAKDAGQFSSQHEFVLGFKHVYRWRPMSRKPCPGSLGPYRCVFHQRMNPVL
jgi:hypothetical protein